MTPSIRLVTTWSGALPDYLPLFFGTVARNPTIEFLFVADSPQPDALPENVRWIERSLPELLTGMGERLGCDLSRTKPFKLCDLRPAYGVALADLFDGCDFWGNVDCDLVLGDLRRFATNERLAAHDVLSFKGSRFVHGPLTFWRNREAINRLYERAHWQEIFTADKHYAFDETCRRWGEDRQPRSVADRRARGEVESNTDVVYTAAAEGLVRIYDGPHIVETKPRGQGPPFALRWKRGRLFNTVGNRELAFFHLHWVKSDPARGDPPYRLPAWHWDALPDEFGITRDGIGPIDDAFGVARKKAIAYEVRGLAGNAVTAPIQRARRIAGRLLGRG